MKVIFFPFLLLFASACSLTTPLGQSRAPEPGKEVAALDMPEPVAQNLISALLQLEQVRDLPGAIEIPKADRQAYPRNVLQLLDSAGYRIRSVSRLRQSNALRYTVAKTVTPSRVLHQYALGIGSVMVEREYEEIDAAFHPYSDLEITGSTSNVLIDDSMFASLEQRDYEGGVRYIQAQAEVAGAAGTIESVNGTELSPQPTQADEFKPVPGTSPTSAVAAVQPSVPRRSSVVTRQLLDQPDLHNVHQLQQSNFHSDLANWKLEQKGVVFFADDSLRLGNAGKHQLHRIAQDFDVDNHRIHLMSCSHGPSGLTNGNEELAKNRAMRVAQELYVLGVAPWRVLAEGCWSDSSYAHAGHPARGVTVHLYRSN